MTAPHATARETDAPAAAGGPPVYLGLRRGWWVVVSLLLLCAVDALPIVGPYLALGMLVWMVLGLAKAAPRRAAPQRALRTRRAERGAEARRGSDPAVSAS